MKWIITLSGPDDKPDQDELVCKRSPCVSGATQAVNREVRMVKHPEKMMF